MAEEIGSAQVGGTLCQACGILYPGGKRFCRICGRPVVGSPSSVATQECVLCGLLFRDGPAQCPHCSSNLVLTGRSSEPAAASSPNLQGDQATGAAIPPGPPAPAPQEGPAIRPSAPREATRWLRPVPVLAAALAIAGGLLVSVLWLSGKQAREQVVVRGPTDTDQKLEVRDQRPGSDTVPQPPVPPTPAPALLPPAGAPQVSSGPAGHVIDRAGLLSLDQRHALDERLDSFERPNLRSLKTMGISATRNPLRRERNVVSI